MGSKTRCMGVGHGYGYGKEIGHWIKVQAEPGSLDTGLTHHAEYGVPGKIVFLNFGPKVRISWKAFFSIPKALPSSREPAVIL